MSILDDVNYFLIDISDYLSIPKPNIEFKSFEDDSRVILKDYGTIQINEKYKDNIIECVKCIAHEARHIWQIYFSHEKDPLAKLFREDLKNAKNTENMKSYEDYLMQVTEVDAFAFQQSYLKTFGDIVVKHPDAKYQKVINAYKTKYYKYL